MTNENTIGGTVAMASPAAAGLKHSLRSATKATSRAKELEESAFQDAEEKMMDEVVMEDEEVTSVESVEDDDKMEETMMQVALMKSVVETTHNPGGGSSDIIGDSKEKDGLKQRLRKCRRRSGQDLERLEHLQSTSTGGMAQRVVKEEDHPAPPVGKKRQRQPSSAADDRKRGSAPALSNSIPNPLSSPLPSTEIRPGTKIKQEADFPDNLTSQLAAAAPPNVTAESSDNKRKVNFNEPMGTRTRGFSIDLDSVGLEILDDASASGATSGNTDMAIAGGGRNRAFSFECFAFGITADEPLPPLEQSVSNVNVAAGSSGLVGRPRGDSIIFDPISFQDGGIHEQHALQRASSALEAVQAASPQTAAKSSASLPSASRVPPRMTKSSSSTKVAAAAAPGQAQSTVVSSASIGTAMANVSLELVNKDGRIGIYLPEARRARIARFHAKREKRIWRKRIKYDCRKKLADSRPRIKGRFVKRSDVDE